MKPIIMIMLAVQAGILLVAASTVIFGRPRPKKPKERAWTSMIIALVVVAGSSWSIGARREGQPGADLLLYGSPLLIGMALMAAFVAIRRRRGLDLPY